MFNPKVIRLARRVAYKNAWIRVEEHTIRLRGILGPRTYGFVAAPPSVSVVAVTQQRRILLVRQYRYPTGGYNFELPGGGSGGLTAAAAARKELQEETGYYARRLRKLGDFVVYCGLSNEICHVFLATGLSAGPQNLEQTEDLSVQAVTYRQLRRMIAGGRFRDGMGLASLHIARGALDRLLG